MDNGSQMLGGIIAATGDTRTAVVDTKTISTKQLLLLKKLTSLSDETLADWLGISVKTYRNYIKARSKMKEHIKHRAVELLNLFRHGIEVFGSGDNFNKWLATENFYFDRKPPAEFLKKINGVKFIDDRLTGMEYGDNV